MPNISLTEILSKRQIIVQVGSGGVGKTTCSVLLAIKAALDGKRVGLLSIDPAKRLADAMGISLHGDLKLVPLPMGCRGSLHAAMLDQKAVFDQMVALHSPNAETAERIYNNSLYRAASTNLSGPLEYMALAKLDQMYHSDCYDLVVIDTPPDSQALDFLKRPNVLSGFQENRVMGWLIKPIQLAGKLGFKSGLSMGKKALSTLATVTGVGSLQTLSEFLLAMQEVIDGFHSTGERIKNLLQSEHTGFVMVSTLTSSSVRSVRSLQKQLEDMGMAIDITILNRCLDAQIAEQAAAYLQAFGTEEPSESLRAICRRKNSEEQQKRLLIDLCHLNHFVEVSEQLGSLHDMESLAQLASAI